MVYRILIILQIVTISSLGCFCDGQEIRNFSEKIDSIAIYSFRPYEYESVWTLDEEQVRMACSSSHNTKRTFKCITTKQKVINHLYKLINSSKIDSSVTVDAPKTIIDMYSNNNVVYTITINTCGEVTLKINYPNDVIQFYHMEKTRILKYCTKLLPIRFRLKLLLNKNNLRKYCNDIVTAYPMSLLF